jgi:hypothetical protein
MSSEAQMICSKRLRNLFFHSIDIMIVNAFIIFQEFKKENPLKFDNLPVHFGQLEFRESLAKSVLGVNEKLL